MREVLEMWKKIIVINFRNSKWTIYYAIFPIILMIILGSSYSGYFSQYENIEKVTNYYYDGEGNEKSKFFLEKVKNESSEISMIFRKVESKNQGIEKVKKEMANFIYLQGEEIKIYGNEKNKRNLGVMTNKFKAVDNVKRNNYVKIEKIKAPNTMSSFQYFGMAEVTMMSLYIINLCISHIKREEREQVLYRIKISGMSNFKYYMINLSGFTLLSIFITLPSYIISIVFLKTNWGPNVIFSYLCILSLSIAMISCGLFLTKSVRDIWKISSLLNTIIIPFISYLGGAYQPMGEILPKNFEIISKLSPLRWVNKGVMRMAFHNDYSVITKALIINVCITIFFMIALSMSKGSEEKLC